jgi:hypothetical protein
LVSASWLSRVAFVSECCCWIGARLGAWLCIHPWSSTDVSFFGDAGRRGRRIVGTGTSDATFRRRRAPG